MPHGDADKGFSLVEMLMTVAVLTIICTMAVGMTPGFLRNAKADSSLVSVMSLVEAARNRAIGERREFNVNFIPPNRIQVARVDVPGPGTTVVSTGYLDGGQTYLLFPGLPDTPDLFGFPTAIYFGNATAVDANGTPSIRFTSDGSLLDSNGDPVNGSIFLGIAGQKSTARALTIFGATGLIRTWKWSGSKWNNQ